MLLVAFPLLSHAQDVGGFLDYRNYFYGFDRGRIKELETLAPRAFGMGGGYMAYATTGGDVKIYKNGELRTIDQGIATVPYLTDNNFGYLSAGTLKVYDGNELHILSRQAGAAVVEDSLAAWFDDRDYTLHVWYKGQSQQVGDALIENPVKRWKSGDNTLAWLDQQTSTFNVFYQGEIYQPATLVKEMRFEAGLDVVAYEDPSDKGLKALYKGEVMDVEPFMPDRLEMGRGLFAYIDKSGALKVFQGGRSYVALDFTPDEFHVEDSLVVIKDKNYMKVFHDGQTETLLQYWPTKWVADWGALAWLDNDNSVNVWHGGKTTLVLQRQPVNDFTLRRGLIIINLKLNQVKIYWNGELYGHG